MAKLTETTAPQTVAAHRTRIYEVMTREPITVREDLSIEGVVDLFRNRGLSRAPVIDARGEIVGIISKSDLVEQVLLRDDTVEVDDRDLPRFEQGLHVHTVGDVVRDVMRPRVFALPATTTLLEAARRMLATNVHAVPVISEPDGKLVGILSATDVMAWVAGAAP